MSRLSVFFLVFSFLVAGCIPSPDFSFQKEESVPQAEWNYNFKPSFKISISDTSVPYQPYFLIQHTDGYPYSNIWVLVYVKKPGDSIAMRERVNVPLADATGKWLGRGMGEIYEQRVPFTFSDTTMFRRRGDYEVTLEQNMRISPLPEVLHVGFRLQKTTVHP